MHACSEMHCLRGAIILIPLFMAAAYGWLMIDKLTDKKLFRALELQINLTRIFY